jgi:glycosyltransferase involved in cell wall biosynthesis
MLSTAMATPLSTSETISDSGSRMSAQTPKISIITPSFNQGRFLEDTILSVLNQNYPNLEYIIIDGGSTDNSVEIVRKYEKYFAYWVSEKDKGHAHAVNKGFARATGEIVGWLNSDDTYLPRALETIANAFQGYPHVGAIYGNGVITTEEGEWLRVKNEIPFSFRRLCHRMFIVQPAFFFKRDLLTRVGYLREDLCFPIDWEFFVRIAKSCKVRHIPKALATYRLQKASKSMAHSSERHAKEDALVRRTALGQENNKINQIVVENFWFFITLALRVLLVLRDNPLHYLAYLYYRSRGNISKED